MSHWVSAIVSQLFPPPASLWNEEGDVCLCSVYRERMGQCRMLYNSFQEQTVDNANVWFSSLANFLPTLLCSHFSSKKPHWWKTVGHSKVRLCPVSRKWHSGLHRGQDHRRQHLGGGRHDSKHITLPAGQGWSSPRAAVCKWTPNICLPPSKGTHSLLSICVFTTLSTISCSLGSYSTAGTRWGGKSTRHEARRPLAPQLTPFTPYFLTW